MRNELNPDLLLSNLAQFTGTTQYYQITARTVLTDGAKYLADAAGCYWLMDAIASHLAGLPETAGFAHCERMDGLSATRSRAFCLLGGSFLGSDAAQRVLSPSTGVF
jgi:hypothetical protein